MVNQMTQQLWSQQEAHVLFSDKLRLFYTVSESSSARHWKTDGRLCTDHIALIGRRLQQRISAGRWTTDGRLCTDHDTAPVGRCLQQHIWRATPLSSTKIICTN